jgi:hypothetical protein
MRFSAVVPDQIIDQVMIEGRVIFDVRLIMPKKLRSDRAIEAFNMAIGLLVPMVVMEVLDRAVTDGDGEVLIELVAIIGLDMTDPKGGDLDELIQEVGSIEAVELVVGIGKAEAPLQIDGRDYIALDFVLKDMQ